MSGIWWPSNSRHCLPPRRSKPPGLGFARIALLEIQSAGHNPEGGIGAFNPDDDRLTEDYRARLDRQSASVRRSQISPAATLSYIFTDLAAPASKINAACTGLGELQEPQPGSPLEQAKRTAIPAFEFHRAGLNQLLGGGVAARTWPRSYLLRGTVLACGICRIADRCEVRHVGKPDRQRTAQHLLSLRFQAGFLLAFVLVSASRSCFPAITRRETGR